MSEEETYDLEKLATAWAEATSSDLSGLFELEVTISSPTLAHGNRDSVIKESGAVVCSRCEVDDDGGGVIWFVVPLQGAMVLAASQAKKLPEEFAEFEAAGFEGEVVENYDAAMDVCAGILGRVLDEEAGLPAIKLDESFAIESLEEDDTIAAEAYRCARFEFEAEGFPKQTLTLLFESELAESWFGGMDARSGEASDLRVAIVDPSDESRDDFARISEEFGAQVMDIDPRDIGIESLEELAEVDYAVVTWNLGDRAGLDLLEQLRTHETTRHLKFAIASAAPTRAMVDAALRWGAQTVLYQPWDAEDVQKWLTESN